MGTYLSLHFSVRSRALSSLITREYNQTPWKPICNLIYPLSESHDRHGHCLRKTSGHVPLVPSQTSMDLVHLLGHSPSSLLHLDRH